MSEHHLFIPRNFKKQAKDGLRGHWGTAVLVGIIVVLLGGFTSGSYYLTFNASDFSSVTDATEVIRNQDWSYLLPIGLGVSLLFWLISIGCNIAFARWARCVVEGEKDISFADFLNNFRFILKGIGITIWKGLWVFIWQAIFMIPAFVIGAIGFFAYVNGDEMAAVGIISLLIAAVLYILGIIVGIIKNLHYSQMFFIATDGPIGVLRAMRISKKMTQDFLGSLFYLYLTFIPWFFVGILTFGLGFIGIVPYMETTFGAAYLFLRDYAFDHGDLDPEEFGLVLAEDIDVRMSMSQPVGEMDSDKTQIIPPLHSETSETPVEPAAPVVAPETEVKAEAPEVERPATGDIFEREYFKGEK